MTYYNPDHLCQKWYLKGIRLAERYELLRTANEYAAERRI